MSDIIPQKPCPRCLQMKPLDAFRKGEEKSGHDSISWCKECTDDLSHLPYPQEEKIKKPKKPRKGGKMPKGTRPCTICGETDLSRFGTSSRRGRIYKKSTCKKCEAERSLQRARKNKEEDPEKYQEIQQAKRRNWRTLHPGYGRQWHYKNLYGLSMEQYQAMLERQSGLCSICRETLKAGKIHLDHCHSTGKVRGLLCPNCNHGLGKFKDDPELLRQAIDYLEKFSPNSSGNSLENH